MAVSSKETAVSTRKRKKNALAVVSNQMPTATKRSQWRNTSKKTKDVSTADDTSPSCHTSSLTKKKQLSSSRKQSKSSKKTIAKHINKCQNLNVAISSYFGGTELRGTVFMPA